MAKAVKGFLAADGTFFKRQHECDAYDHSEAIRRLCESQQVSYDKFLNLVELAYPHIRGYFNAVEQGEQKTKQASSAPSGDNADEPGASDGLEALFQQPSR